MNQPEEINEPKKDYNCPMHTAEFDISSIKLFEKCDKCPCCNLLTQERKKQIKKWIELFSNNLSKIDKVKLFILGESMPANKYFYDENSDYKSNGFRYKLRKGLLLSTDKELFSLLNKKGIVVIDCAFCPLHTLNTNKEKRHSATYCLENYNLQLIEHYHNIPIYSFFQKIEDF
ncbi:MAG: hypothetical protein LUD02_12830 [Tannerellaceae bacterium]|nr:hypothetical protein [Tannerellaceae bacterium]